MARVALYVASVWGGFPSLVALSAIVSNILSAQYVRLSGWTIHLKDEQRTGGYYAVHQDDVPVLFIPYFAIGAILLVCVAILGPRWLRSSHRAIWFGSVAAILLVLSFLGMIAGVLLFGPPLLVFVVLALSQDSGAHDGRARRSRRAGELV